MLRTGGMWALALGAVCVAATARGTDLVGETSATFAWSVPTGGASAYIVYVDRNGEGMKPVTLVSTNGVTLDGYAYGDEIAVSVVAYERSADANQFSAPSPASDTVRFVAPPRLATAASVLLECAECGTLQLRSLADGGVVAELPAPTDSWEPEAAGDLDGDGSPDLLLRARSGSWLGVAAMLLGPGGTPRATLLGEIGSQMGLDAADTAATLGDLDGDGRDEALLVLPSLGVVVWSPAPAGSGGSGGSGGSELDAVAFVASRAGEQLVGVADFDGDGTDDLLWRDDASGSLRVARIRNRAEVASIAVGAPAPPGAQPTLADWDGDGDADLLWRNDTDGTLTLWVLDGGRFAQAQSLPAVAGDAQCGVVGGVALGGGRAASALLQDAVTGRLLLVPSPATGTTGTAGYRIALLDPGAGWRALGVVPGVVPGW